MRVPADILLYHATTERATKGNGSTVYDGQTRMVPRFAWVVMAATWFPVMVGGWTQASDARVSVTEYNRCDGRPSFGSNVYAAGVVIDGAGWISLRAHAPLDGEAGGGAHAAVRRGAQRCCDGIRAAAERRVQAAGAAAGALAPADALDAHLLNLFNAPDNLREFFLHIPVSLGGDPTPSGLEAAVQGYSIVSGRGHHRHCVLAALVHHVRRARPPCPAPCPQDAPFNVLDGVHVLYLLSTNRNLTVPRARGSAGGDGGTPARRVRLFENDG